MYALTIIFIKFCVSLFLFINLPKPNFNPHVIYVSVHGNDRNIGTINHPLRSIDVALSKACAGDTVLLRGGIYHEKILFKKSGKYDHYIVLKGYPDERVRIDGHHLSITGREGLVTIDNISFVTIEGIEICNYKFNKPNTDVNGILIEGSAHDIVIRNNKIHNIENNASPEKGRSGHAILVIGNTNTPITKITLEDNLIYDCKTGYSENVTINGYVDSFNIIYNKICNGENIGIVAAGGYKANKEPEHNYARHGLIAHNILSNIDGTRGPVPAYANRHGAPAIYIDGARDVIIENNTISNCDRGIGLVSENNEFPTEKCIVSNNFIHNCWLSGIYLGNYLHYTGGGTVNCLISKNILKNNDKTTGYYNEIEGEIRLTENCVNNSIINNNITAGYKDVLIHKYTNSGFGNIIDFNVYHLSNDFSSWIWNGVMCDNFSLWQQLSKQDVLSKCINE